MDLYFQGKALLYKKWTPEYLAEARGFFERALELDLTNTEAVVSLALVETVIGAGFVTDKGSAHLAVAEAMSVKALSLAPNHAYAHFVLGTVLISTNRAAQGIAELERALALDRNLAWAHGQIGAAKLFMGRAAETESHMNEAFRLSPRDIFGFNWLQIIGFAKLQLTADAEAVGWFLRSIEDNRNYPMAHFGLAAALALLGSMDEARSAAEGWTCSRSKLYHSPLPRRAQSNNPINLAYRERVYQGMRLAGVPDG